MTTHSHIERQIFIGGCGRSGTTLLGAMLGAHSDCICAPESHFKMRALRPGDWTSDSVDLMAAFKRIRRHWRFKIWELDLPPSEVPVEELDGSYPRLLEWMATRFADHVGKPDARIWVDHTPENIIYAPTLLKLFPQAKIIHIVRDGRGVASSIMPLDWGPSTIVAAARWWLDNVTYGLALETLMEADRIVRVKYEDLVSDPLETLGELSASLGIDFQPGMIEANGFTPPRYTVNQHKLIGKKPDARRATRWETRLTPRQIEIFESMAHDFLHYLGYPLRYGLAARGPTLGDRGVQGIREFGRDWVVNPVRWLRRSYRLWLGGSSAQ